MKGILILCNVCFLISLLGLEYLIYVSFSECSQHLTENTSAFIDCGNEQFAIRVDYLLKMGALVLRC